MPQQERPKKTQPKAVTKPPLEIQQHPSLAEALLYAQWEYPPILKNNVVDFMTKETNTTKSRRVNYSYTDLGTLKRLINPCLHKHGLVVSEGNRREETGETFLVIKLRHIHGEKESDEIDFPLKKPGFDLKEMAREITYLTRYGYGMITGCVTEDDIDADGLSQPDQDQPPPQGSRPPVETLGSLKGQYHDLYKKNQIFANDDERHVWQAIAFPSKPSSSQWKDKATFKKAISLLHWRMEVGVESDKLLEYITTKAISVKGLTEQFLGVMTAKNLTDVKSVKGWQIGMAAAKLSLEFKMASAINMGQALLRANEYEGLYDTFLKANDITKLSTLPVEGIRKWREKLTFVFDEWSKDKEVKPELINTILDGE